jgi:potassium efflux system protein
MLVMIALFAVMFWAIWSDLITVFAYLDSITLWQYNGTEAGAAVMKSVTMGSLLFALVSSVVAWALIRNLPGLLEVLLLSRLNLRQGRPTPLPRSSTTSSLLSGDDGLWLAWRLVG